MVLHAHMVAGLCLPNQHQLVDICCGGWLHFCSQPLVSGHKRQGKPVKVFAQNELPQLFFTLVTQGILE
jgi:hypothetical protein